MRSYYFLSLSLRLCECMINSKVLNAIASFQVIFVSVSTAAKENFYILLVGDSMGEKMSACPKTVESNLSH